MTRPLAIFVVVVVVLAGCHGFVPWVDGGSTGSPTADGSDGRVGDTLATDTRAVDGDGAKPGTEPTVHAPGLTAQGVRNASRLLDRHFAILERESENGTYVAVFQSRETERGFPFEKAVSAREVYAVQHPERWYRFWSPTLHTAGEQAVYEEWVNATDALLRADRPDEPIEFRAQTRSSAPGHPTPLVRQLHFLLDPFDPERTDAVTVEGRERNETTVYVVSSTSAETSLGATTRTTRTFHVREDGFITRYSRVSTRDLPNGDTVVAERYLSFDVHPEEHLEVPDWVRWARGGATDERVDDRSVAVSTRSS